MQSREELKVYCEEVIATLQPYFDVVGEIALSFYNDADTMSFPQYQPIEHKLVGIFSFINTKYKEVSAISDNAEAAYFNSLKCKSEIDRVKFVSEVAKREAEEYAKDLRLTSAILESWVNNIEQLLTTCRRSIYAERAEKRHG